jgi:hypothetical protein
LTVARFGEKTHYFLFRDRLAGASFRNLWSCPLAIVARMVGTRGHRFMTTGRGIDAARIVSVVGQYLGSV